MTYSLRLIGGASVALALGLALWTLIHLKNQSVGGSGFGSPPPPANPILTFGATLFGKLNLFIFLSIWVCVPLAAADAISRERREGTLPLLYLTELRSYGIILGKAFVHMLRSSSLFLTMAPWLMLPVVFGGVGLNDVRMALILDFTAVLLAQAAGLLASAFPRDWLRSVILAEVFSLFLFWLMLSVHGTVLNNALNTGLPPGLTPGTPSFWGSSYAMIWLTLQQPGHAFGIISETIRWLELTTNGSFRQSDVGSLWQAFGPFGGQTASSDWQQIWTSLTPPGIHAWFAGATMLLIGAMLILLATLAIAALRIEKSWQDAPAPLAISELRRKYFSPRFQVRALRRRLSRSLSANPIGWLQHYSPSARLVKWTWCLLIIFIEIFFSWNWDDLYQAQKGLGLLLLLGLTFSATASFRNELETGAFELLLVTPLRESQIIVGRLRGLWRQFLPALVIYGAGSIYLSSGWRTENYAQEAWTGLAKIISVFCTLPLIGLYFSVMRWNFFAAWLAASLIGLLPAVLSPAFGVTNATVIPWQLGAACVAAFLLHDRLRSREFVIKR